MPLGWSSGYPVNTPWQAEWIDQALALLNAALCESLVELATLKGHIDPDLYDVFVQQQVYRRYAEGFLKPEQIDQ